MASHFRLRQVMHAVLAVSLALLPLSSFARLVPSTAPVLRGGGVPPSWVPPSGEDPCAMAGAAAMNSFIVPIDLAISCQKSFPFNFDMAAATIDTLLKTIPFYVFVDLAKNSPEPLLPSNVDLEKSLLDIYAQAHDGRFATEYEFEIAVSLLFMSLNDAHTMYTPQCFGVWLYTPTFVLLAVTAEDGRLQIKIAPARFQVPELIASTSTLVGRELSSFIGADVLSIDGTPALDYLIRFAQTRVGLAKDLNARFNAALLTLYVNLESNQEFNRGAFFAQTIPPPSASITLTLRRQNAAAPETLPLPYQALYTGNAFSSSAEYFNGNCRAKSEGRGSGSGSPLTASSMRMGTVSQGPPLAPTPVLSGAASAFLLADGRTGVVAIPTLLPPKHTDGTDFWGTFMLFFGMAVEGLRRRGAQRLILDLTLNGGGIIDGANWMANALFPSPTTPRTLPTRLRANDLAVEMARAADELGVADSLYHWSNWADAAGAPFRSLADGFFFPLTSTPESENGNSSSLPRWSAFFTDRTARDVGLPAGLVAPFGGDPPFDASDIMILTNGFCGSACSIIASSLSQFYGVRTVTVGGLPWHPQQISNFPGSQVLELGALLGEIGKLGLQGDPRAPRPLGRNTDFRFTFRQLWGPASEKYPLEFVFEPSTFNLDYTEETATSVAALWDQVSRLF